MADWGFIATSLVAFKARRNALSDKPVAPHNLEELRLLKHVIHDLEALAALREVDLTRVGPCPHGRADWQWCPHCTGNS